MLTYRGALTPTATVRRTDRSGDTITVIVDPQTDHDDRAWYEFIVTQIANPPKEPRRLIPEQVIRETPLRNALTHFEAGIQRVRVITKTLPTFIVSQPQSVGDDESDKTAYIEYDQQTYKVEAKPPEQSQTPSTCTPADRDTTRGDGCYVDPRQE